MERNWVIGIGTIYFTVSLETTGNRLPGRELLVGSSKQIRLVGKRFGLKIQQNITNSYFLLTFQSRIETGTSTKSKKWLFVI